MCMISKDSLSKPTLFRALLELPLSTIDKNKDIICSSRYIELYMPTVARNVKDYLVSTYELCEDG